ncbi:unnamed protein product, partial [Protopolystoma xenopodis]
MSGVLCHLDEVETQLSCLEAWINLPVDCFNPALPSSACTTGFPVTTVATTTTSSTATTTSLANSSGGISVATTSGEPEIDYVCQEAQFLVDVVSQLQASLLSMVSTQPVSGFVSHLVKNSVIEEVCPETSGALVSSPATLAHPSGEIKDGITLTGPGNRRLR